MAWTGSLTDLERRLAQTQPFAVSGGIGGSYAAPAPDLSFLNDPNNPYNQQQQQQYADNNYATQESSAPSDVGTVAPPVKVLETSPEWLAYINALGLQKNQFAADIARQREIAGANASFARAGVEPQFAKQRQGIAGNAESRGLSRSGMVQKALAGSRGDEARAYGGIYQNLTNTLSDLQSSVAQKNVDLDTQRAQQYANLLGAGYTSNGTGANG